MSIGAAVGVGVVAGLLVGVAALPIAVLKARRAAYAALTPAKQKKYDALEDGKSRREFLNNEATSPEEQAKLKAMSFKERVAYLKEQQKTAKAAKKK